MKIEKLNDNQIRCILTREDLADRKIKLSELAYGSEKAKSLVSDMMQQAAFEFGFEANDMPLMIEAIPMSSEALVLIITKVEDPEELDTRFAKFSPGNAREETADISELLSGSRLEGADDILNLFQKIREAHKSLTEKNTARTEPAGQPEPGEGSSAEAPARDISAEISKLYTFRSLDDVILAARVIKSSYHGYNSLYRSRTDGCYTLILNKSSHTPEEFNKICNMITEYASSAKYTAGAEAFLAEHGELIVAGEALQKLGTI